MKRSIQILLISTALSLTGYILWRSWQPNLTGHWHIIEQPLDGHSSTLDWMETLDITDNNAVHLNYTHGDQYPMNGEVDRLFRNIYIGPSCLSLYVKYHPDGGTLYLEIPSSKNPSSPQRLTAIKRVKCHHSWKPE